MLIIDFRMCFVKGPVMWYLRIYRLWNLCRVPFLSCLGSKYFKAVIKPRLTLSSYYEHLITYIYKTLFLQNMLSSSSQSNVILLHPVSQVLQKLSPFQRLIATLMIGVAASQVWLLPLNLMMKTENDLKIKFLCYTNYIWSPQSHVLAISILNKHRDLLHQCKKFCWRNPRLRNGSMYVWIL